MLPYTETRLDSGFTLVHKEVRSAPIVAIDIWIHTGAVHDPEPHYGLSHYYEHMFFKGTEKHGVGEMDRIITELGGYNNAATSYDYTHYFVVLPTAGWKQALEVMIDSLLNPLFPEDEVERERKVIVEEIKRHEDNPWSSVYENFTHEAFASCPYQRQILGTKDSLNTISRETFLEYKTTRYQPANTTISIVGDCSHQEAQDHVESLVQAFQAPTASDSPNHFEMIDSPRETVIERDVNQSYLLIGYPTTRLIDTRHEYAMDLISTILGDGRSSRLHRCLHDDLGLVSSINASFWAMVHAGLFVIEAVTEPENVNRVEQEITNELDRLRQDIKSEELAKAKNMIHSDYSFANEKVISIANTYGYSRVAANIEHAVQYLNNMDTITLQDLELTYDEFITEKRRCQGILRPKKN